MTFIDLLLECETKPAGGDTARPFFATQAFFGTTTPLKLKGTGNYNFYVKQGGSLDSEYCILRPPKSSSAVLVPNGLKLVCQSEKKSVLIEAAVGPGEKGDVMQFTISLINDDGTLGESFKHHDFIATWTRVVKPTHRQGFFLRDYKLQIAIYNRLKAMYPSPDDMSLLLGCNDVLFEAIKLFLANPPKPQQQKNKPTAEEPKRQRMIEQSQPLCQQITSGVLDIEYTMDGLHKDAELMQKLKQSVDDAAVKAFNAFLNMGMIHFSSGNWDQAMQDFVRAEWVATSIGEHFVHLAKRWIARIYLKQGRLLEAEELFLVVLAFFDNDVSQAPDRELELSVCHSDLGWVYHDRLNENFDVYFNKALEHFNQAIYLRTEHIGSDPFGNTHRIMVEDYYGLGVILLLASNGVELAGKQFATCQEIFVKAFRNEKTMVTSKVYRGLGLVAAKQGNYAEAIPHIKKALEHREESSGKEHPQVGNLWFLLSHVLRSNGDVEEADRCRTEALRIWEKCRVPEGHAWRKLPRELQLQTNTAPTAAIQQMCLDNDDFSMGMSKLNALDDDDFYKGMLEPETWDEH